MVEGGKGLGWVLGGCEVGMGFFFFFVFVFRLGGGGREEGGCGGEGEGGGRDGGRWMEVEEWEVEVGWDGRWRDRR